MRRGLGVAIALLSLACAPKTGWAPVGRVCAAAGPPTVCFEAAPDQPLELRWADVVLVPGECVQASQSRGGWGRLYLVDGRGGSRRASVVVAPGRRTTIRAGAEGRIDVVERTACDATVTARRDAG